MESILFASTDRESILVPLSTKYFIPAACLLHFNKAALGAVEINKESILLGGILGVTTNSLLNGLLMELAEVSTDLTL